jgi:hypothetical protein
MVNVWLHLALAFHSGRETDQSPPSTAEVKEWVEMYLQSPNTPSWRGAQRDHRVVSASLVRLEVPYVVSPSACRTRGDEWASDQFLRKNMGTLLSNID